jgi:hypothetical protein
MTSKKYFNIAGVFIVIFIVTYFVELFELSIWIHRIAGVIFAVFAFLGFYQTKKEENQKTK